MVSRLNLQYLTPLLKDVQVKSPVSKVTPFLTVVRVKLNGVQVKSPVSN